MATASSFNKSNSAIKRIMREARELADDPSTDYTAAPLEENLFEWHCTIRGPSDTEFEGGLYHFRIILPGEYPFRPPSLVMLTPSGRFETNTKICISFTNYHEEMWQPAWGVRTAIIGLQGFFPLKGQAAMGVGSMEAPASERRRLAKLSRAWVCPQCSVSNEAHLPDVPRSIRQEDQPPFTPPTSCCATTSERVVWTAGVAKPDTGMEMDANLKQGFPMAAISSLALGPGPQGPAVLERDRTERGELAMSAPGPTRGAAGQQQWQRQHYPASAAVADCGQMGESRQATRSESAPARTAPGVQNKPWVLDGLICVLLVLVAALLCRKVL